MLASIGVKRKACRPHMASFTAIYLSELGARSRFRRCGLGFPSRARDIPPRRPSAVPARLQPSTPCGVRPRVPLGDGGSRPLFSAPSGMSPEHRKETIMPTIANLNVRSEEHTSELQSLMRTSYDVFCLQ